MANDGGGSLVLRDVSAGYGAAEPLLRRVDLSLAAGEIVCVLGPNGAGKTTLVRVASGLLAPATGEVRLLGEPLAGKSRLEIAKVLAVVEQMQELSEAFTVREVVALGRAPHQDAWMHTTAEDRRIVDDALARCDLVALASRSARALSGGEQKRVAVARALAQEPRVLLLDEPGAFLDVRHQLDLYELLARSVARERLACLVVMHDLNVAAQFADRVVLLKRGAVVASGAVRDVLTRDIVNDVFDAALYVGERDGVPFFLPQRHK
ncbi:MAG: ABC transporter ATP-binding protein [Labilithrix sp.]|nr:ABC transporter ATP-binding protein [Labilithrix sp.]MCW5810466.1 ABC transporter ATP-binding protein [Labilithrix sp.]